MKKLILCLVVICAFSAPLFSAQQVSAQLEDYDTLNNSDVENIELESVTDDASDITGERDVNAAMVGVDMPCKFVYSYALVNKYREHGGVSTSAGKAVDLGANKVKPKANGHVKQYQVCTDDKAIAAIPGKVTFAGWDKSGLGNRVEITSNGGTTKVSYGHLQTISVKAGKVVKVGDPIGVIGKTGGTTFKHIHFSVYKSGFLKYSQWQFMKLN